MSSSSDYHVRGPLEIILLEPRAEAYSFTFG